ncbi:hypothetical protein [Aureimonas sp. ME7]|uniref:hypothetical protein n=1 Tax=Aureimonas sp. ME7 TaxID=2744252 RepID=UPI0015F936BC|nr:hypothetical protein [Aureimonas sp. ME7]
MPHDRIWTDPKAEAEFWRRMAEIEELSGQTMRAGVWGRLARWIGRTDPSEAIRRQAEDLVQRHTILVPTAEPTEAAEPAPGAALRTLAGLAVGLRQDRAGEADEAAAARSA